VIPTEINPQRLPPPESPALCVEFAELADRAAQRIVVGDPGWIRNVNVAFIGASGTGKTSGAARLLRLIRDRAQWLSAMAAPWVQATWLADNIAPHHFDSLGMGRTLAAFYEQARIVVVDGLGEESVKGRHNVENLLRHRLDNAKPTIITTRLALEGQGSLRQLFPAVRAALDHSFAYTEVR
jgi:DNA replication protein DnaC